jgi:CRISPR-associated protein Cas1
MPSQRRAPARLPATVVSTLAKEGVAPVVVRDGVLVLSGYGLRVAVERGHLAVADGIGSDRRAGLLARATCGLRRLVVLGHAGTVSLEALRWLHDLGAAFAQLDADGRVVACFAPSGLDDPRLRRAQALAPTTGVGIALARELLVAKLRGQAALLPRLPGGEIARPAVDQALADLEQAGTTEQLRQAEAAGAKAYWAAWTGLPVAFARKDAGKVPAHWLAFGARSSPLTGSPRTAADPANALLNYLYALLEAEARVACLALGLDPGLGVLHADLKARDSLALDLMEVARPAVDAYVLDLLDSRVLSRDDVFETRQRGCRLLPPLTERLAETTGAWAKAVGPWAERAAKLLLAGTDAANASALPTPLTGANRRAGQGRQTKDATVWAPKPPAACRGCGLVLEDDGRRWCDACLIEHRAEEAVRIPAVGQAALAERRAAGADPAHGGAAAAMRGTRNAAHQQANAAFDADQEDELDPEAFRRDILPLLRDAPTAAIVAATGLSQPYCNMIKRGSYVPHPRHWTALMEVLKHGGSARKTLRG